MEFKAHSPGHYAFPAIVAALLALLCSLPARGQDRSPLKLTSHAISLRNGKKFSLNLPQGYEIRVAAQGLKRVRFMTLSPDGRIFATDMYDLSDNSRGTIYIFNGFDARTGKIARVVPYLKNLRNPNNVAFYTDSAGQTWLYVALTDRLERFPYRAGDVAPSGPPENLATYPDYGLSYKYGGWHLTRTVAFSAEKGPAKMYVSVGSSCNVCEEKEEIRATVSEMDPDGKNARIIARGLRNAVGLEFTGGKLYATNMGADHLGDDAPNDTMFILDSANGAEPGEPKNYGWPYCYFKDGQAVTDPLLAHSTKNINCAQSASAVRGLCGPWLAARARLFRCDRAGSRLARVFSGGAAWSVQAKSAAWLSSGARLRTIPAARFHHGVPAPRRNLWASLRHSAHRRGFLYAERRSFRGDLFRASPDRLSLAGR